MEQERRYYTVEEAMQILGVNRDTIYRYIKKGKIESVKLGRDHKILKDSIDSLLKPCKN